MDGYGSASWTTPFKVLGIPVRLHLGWLLVAVLIGWSLAMGSLPTVYAGLPQTTYWAMAAAIILGVGLSILLHEFAHALAGRALGISVDRITLFVFGGVAELHEEPRTALSELGMAVAGPMFSVILCGVLAFAAGAAEVSGAPEMVFGGLTFVATLNLVMAVFNLLPAFPLDGGRIFRAVVWMITGDLDRATVIATGLGKTLAVLLMIGGLFQAVGGGLESGLWTILIGIFLQYAAGGAQAEADARRLLGARRVGEFMSRDVECVPASMTLARFVDERLVASHHALYPVVADTKWAGLLQPADVLRTPRELWATTTVGEVCAPPERVAVLSPDDRAANALERLQAEGRPGLPVIDRGAVVGLVTLKDLQARLAVERTFQRPRPGMAQVRGRPHRAANVGGRHVLEPN